ncbi:MAG: hypothetical protein KF799_05875 [Bdellovibrionales bacterium]|nr:hypothetical protein [Bdellovibrionales bacterium]
MTHILISFLSAVLAVAQPSEPCPTRVRAVFDVGSGSTKMNVSQVELCPDKTRVVRVLDDRSSMDVALEAGKDSSGRIPEKTIQALIGALKQLKDKAITLAKELPKETGIEFSAAATHALRTAANKKQVTDRIETLGIPVLVLTQEQEAIAGVSGVQGLGCAGKPILVWDVGGGSQQWTLLGLKPEFSGLPLGAEGFKKKLISELGLKRELKCEARGLTPNPIGKASIKKAEEIASKEASALPAPLKAGDHCVIGIGGVHNKAIAAQIEKQWSQISKCACTKPGCKPQADSYNRRQLECLADLLADKDDCDSTIKGPYSTTAVSNLYLVAGLMKAMKIDTVHTENVNMGHGLVLDQKLLTFRNHSLGRD